MCIEMSFNFERTCIHQQKIRSIIAFVKNHWFSEIFIHQLIITILKYTPYVPTTQTNCAK